MTIARLARKLHAYAPYYEFRPQQAPGRGARTVRRTSSTSTRRSGYPAFLACSWSSLAHPKHAWPAVVLICEASPPPTSRSPAHRFEDGVTALEQLCDRGPFAPIFTPVIGSAHLTDAWLRPQAVAA
ncbi:hypothetical protein [Streptomyces sp. NBC_01643]|uniref:hypothetical protein n=1 Tax=Streptomyces sp. NBC_01643 TaxID=2975906 RepID=UPI002F919E72|nr:hypothetical protein OHB03_49445 [Streptomyces sp. NBC_01643]